MNTKKKNNYLIHYGKKGMKWGVRKDKTKDITKKRWSNKKLEKKAYKLSKDKSSNYRKVLDKMSSEFTNSKEYKDTVSAFNKMSNSYKTTNSTYLKDIVDYNKKAEKANKIARSIADKYRSESAGAILKDLKYADTKKGREWVMQRMNVTDTKKKK